MLTTRPAQNQLWGAGLVGRVAQYWLVQARIANPSLMISPAPAPAPALALQVLDGHPIG